MKNDPTDLTQFPVPNSSFYVFERNASDVDKLVNGGNTTVVNRSGKALPTFEKAIADARISYGGFNPTGTYQSGGFNYSVNDLFDEGETTYLVLRDFVSTTFIADAAIEPALFTVQQGYSKQDTDDGFVKKISSVFDIDTFANLEEGQTAYLKEYHSESGIGGGPGEIKLARHNGGTAISLTRERPTDWSDHAQLADWFSDSGDDELCFVRTNGYDKYISAWGVKENGSCDLIFAKMKSLVLNCHIDVSCELSEIVNFSTDAQLVTWDPTKTFTVNGDGRLYKTGNNIQFHNLTAFSNNALYVVLDEGNDNLRYNCKYSGTVGHYDISSGGTRPKVLFCESEGLGQTTPFVFSSCNEFKASNVTLKNHDGFGIQARFCDGGLMSNCKADNPFYFYPLTAVPAQTEYTFTVDKVRSRWGLYIADNQGSTARPILSLTVSGLNVTVTIGDPTVIGSGEIVLVGFDSLENYQINSGCKDVIISDCEASGSGDSNIVIGADYHYNGTEWVLDPSNVVESDWPVNSIVSNNILKHARNANISNNNGGGITAINGNTCMYAGYEFDVSGVLDCNINSSLRSSITNNTCISDASKIITWGGIASTPTDMKSTLGGKEKVLAALNSFEGQFITGEYVLGAQMSGNRRSGLKIEGSYKSSTRTLQELIDIAWSGKPTNTDYWSFAQNGAGWVRNTTLIGLAGSALIETVPTAYVDCYPKFFQLFKKKSIVRISLLAQSDGYVDVYTGFNGANIIPKRISFSNSLFTEYEMYLSVENFDLFFLRVGSESGDTGYIQDIKIEWLNIN